MIYSKGSVVVRGQGAHDRLAGVPVVPDGGGHGEDALEDADGHAGGGAAAVVFESELVFEGVVDRFDGLPDGAKQHSTGSWWFVAVGGPDNGDIGFVEPGFGGTVAVALVDHQDQPVPVAEHGRLQGNQIDQDVTFVELRVGQRERHGQAVHGGDQVQTQS